MADLFDRGRGDQGGDQPAPVNQPETATAKESSTDAANGAERLRRAFAIIAD